MNKKIIFISSGLALPRIIKRVKSFTDCGYCVEIYGFDRGMFQDMNTYPESVVVHHLGELPDGTGYINNFKEHYKKFKQIFNKYRSENIIYYSMGFMPAVLVSIFGQKPYIYEISDLIYGTFRNKFLKTFFAFIDRMVIKHSLLTVLTSQGFLDYLYPKYPPKNTIIQPNKLSSVFDTIMRKKVLVNENIRFGFIGYIRYPNTIFRFASIIGEKYPNYSFDFYGDSKYRDGAIELSNKYPNVHYHGKYKNPEELEKIYDSIDVVLACYDTATFNEQVAEPNKLYESLYFSKPIIVSPGTYLAKRIEELKCGYILDATKDMNIIAFLENLTVESVNEILEREYNMDKTVMIDDPRRIIDRVRELTLE